MKQVAKKIVIWRHWQQRKMRCHQHGMLDIATFTTLCAMVVFCLRQSCYAQGIKNNSFENWENVSAYGGSPEDPVGWTSTNALTISSGGYLVAKRSSDAHQGSYALKLFPWKSENNQVFTTSQICYGMANFNPENYSLDYFFSGDTISLRPGSISGYYKFMPGRENIDSAYAIVYLKKQNPIDPWVDGIVAEGSISFKETNNQYAPFTIPINYLSDNDADTLVIAFFYKSNGTTDSSGFLLLDDLKVESHPTGMAPSDWNQNEIRLLPNPTKDDYIYIQGTDKILGMPWAVYDLSGRIVKAGVCNNKKINISKLRTGTYLFKLNSGSYQKVIKFLKY